MSDCQGVTCRTCNAICDSERWVCQSYSLCKKCFTKQSETTKKNSQKESESVPEKGPNIEKKFLRLVELTRFCSWCNITIIGDTHYKCENCWSFNYNFCEMCEGMGRDKLHFDGNHRFKKIVKPTE